MVANQVRGKYEAKEPSMISYLAKVKALTAKIRGFKVELMPRNQSTQVDTLSKLASSTLSKLNKSEYLKVHHHRNIDQGPATHNIILEPKLPEEKNEASKLKRKPPVDLGTQSLRVGPFSVENEQQQKEYLDFRDEVQDEARQKMIIYKQRVSKCYNRRVSARILKVGDLVLRNASVVQKDKIHRKLSANWEGTYEIADELQPVTYKLR
ncbi:Serine hydroxymethyltransferase [Bienertia sinuspersici]